MPTAQPVMYFSTQLSRSPFGLILAIAILAMSRIASGNPTDDEIEPNGVEPARQANVADATVYQWIFYEPIGPGDARQRLNTILRQKIAIVDRLCGLTVAQKGKLQLAVRGDVKRFFDQVKDIEEQFLLIRNDPEKVKSLNREAQLLQRGLVRTGVPRGGWLLDKSLEQLLTAEQAIKSRPIRAVFREGGLIETWPQEPDEVLGINLGGTGVTDDDLEYISEISRLASLNLSGTGVSDAGISHLARLVSLQTLSLQDTQVTDAGLVHLKGLAKLEWLAISSQRVTNLGLRHLNELIGLKGLLLGKTRITDAGLVNFERLISLQMLGLSDTQITDKGLAQLKHLTNLEQLYLGNTQVSDEGLENIRELKSLKQLGLGGTQVTESGMAELKNALPTLTIHK